MSVFDETQNTHELPRILFKNSTLSVYNCLSVHPKGWNDNRKQVKATAPHHIHYNKLIKEQHHKAESIIIDHYLKPLPVVEFISKLKDKHYGNEDFYIFIENENELIKSARSSHTMDNYHNLINKMKEWKLTLTFSEITLEYIQRFHDSCSVVILPYPMQNFTMLFTAI